MNGHHSRLLQVVVAAVLVSVAPDGRAETYDLPGVSAEVPDDYWEGADFESGYNWEFDDSYERSGSGSEDPETDEEKNAACDSITSGVPATCNLRYPPELIQNGCGTGATANIVPDSLIVNGVTVARFGNLFTSACNRHDTCYGTFGTDKETCDIALGVDMLNKARDVIPTYQWAYYESHVIVQAAFYSSFLRSSFGELFSNQAFEAAQIEGLCRKLHTSAVSAGCSI